MWKHVADGADTGGRGDSCDQAFAEAAREDELLLVEWLNALIFVVVKG